MAKKKQSKSKKGTSASKSATKSPKTSSPKRVKSVPDGYNTATPYIVVDGAARFIDFLKTAFKAKERGRMEGPEGRIMHAEVMIGNSIIMLSDAMGESTPIPCMLMFYVEDVDKVFNNAVNAGATVIREVEDQWYGDRAGALTDEFGNRYWIATRIENIPTAEMKKRQQQWMSEQEQKGAEA